MAPERRAEIERFIAARPEVRRVFSLITLQLGNDIMLAVQAEMADTTVDGATMVLHINAVEAAVKAEFPDVRWSFFEPDDSP